MSFHEVSFPTDIAYGSAGGPTRRVEIISLDSGFEQRNSPWSQSRHRFNVSYGVKTYDQLHTVIAFWQARSGPLFGFRYKDFSDYKSVAPQQAVNHQDQVLGTGNGVLTTFQLIKKYTSGPSSFDRTIKKPISGTVRVALNTTEQLSGFTVDTTTGIVTFSTPPANGVVVKAGFEFEVPVRFEADQLTINMEAFKHGTLEDINLIEVRV